MFTDLYRYQFGTDVRIEDAEAALLLALVAVEGLHGESETRLDALHALDRGARTCVIDAATDVGRDLNRIFVGFLRREYGDESFDVRRIVRRSERDEDRTAPACRH